jgi:hypothetical protein
MRAFIILAALVVIAIIIVWSATEPPAVHP